jgi:hypothetical protein
MSDDVRLVKLINGEQVIAKVGDFTETEGHYRLDKAVTVVPVGPNQIGMRPWLGAADFDQPIFIQSGHVIVTAPVDTELAREYNQQYHGGIAVATPQEAAALEAAEKKLVLE